MKQWTIMTNKTTTPEISVIMPVYNTSLYLRQSIESVINQTFTNWELICINDGSTDNSLEILEEYASKDPRITIIDQENQGLSCARNSGLEIAQGDYITFIDSDDFYAKNFLEVVYNNIKTKQGYADIVGCNFKKIKSLKDDIKKHCAPAKIYKDALKVLLHPKNFIHFNVWNKLYKREVIEGYRFVPNMLYEDWVFNCQIFEHANSFVWINSPLYGYRISKDSIMRSSYNEKKINDYVRGIEEVYNHFNNKKPEAWLNIRRARISRTVKMMMNSALRSKNKSLLINTKQVLKELKKKELITYQGLSLKNKIRLFKFLW